MEKKEFIKLAMHHKFIEYYLQGGLYLGLEKELILQRENFLRNLILIRFLFLGEIICNTG